MSKILFIIILFPLALKAQMMPMPMTIKTPYGNVNSTTWVPAPYRYNNYGAVTISRVIKRTMLTIVLSNDSVMVTKAKFDAESDQNSIEIKGSKKKPSKVYLPGDTKKVYRQLTTTRLIGVPADTCWLFKIKPGKISMYSNVPIPDMDNFICAVQAGDSTIVKLNPENLLSIMESPSQKVRELIDEKKLLRAIWLYNEDK